MTLYSNKTITSITRLGSAVFRRLVPREIIEQLQKRKTLKHWERMGMPLPPPSLFKQETVKYYSKKFSITTLIESGTYLGDMVYATKDTFSQIISIELDEKLYKQAVERFSGFSSVSIIQGDSGELMPRILNGITKPCLFWLDGHYSEGVTAKGKLETPIVEELTHILNHSVAGHVILIDDARLFTGAKDYPSISALQEYVLARHPKCLFDVDKDIIRILPYGGKWL